MATFTAVRAGGNPPAVQQVQGEGRGGWRCRGRWPGRVGSGVHPMASSRLVVREAGTGRIRPGLTARQGSERRVVVELAARLAVGGALGPGRRPPQRGADLLGLDLDNGAALTLRGLPAPGPELTEDDDPVALGEGVADVLGELPPGGDAVEAGVAVAPAVAVLDAGGHGQAEVADGGAVGGEADLGVVGQVAGDGDVGVGHGCPLLGGSGVVLASRSRWRSGQLVGPPSWSGGSAGTGGGGAPRWSATVLASCLLV